jgi:hypothetical protein
MSCPRRDFSWNESPRPELFSVRKDGRAFREQSKSETGMAQPRPPAGRAGLFLATETLLKSKQPRFAVGVGTLRLSFQDVFVPLRRGFPLWQRNQSPRPELLWCGSLFPRMSLVPSDLSPAPHTQPEAGLFLQHDCERQPDIAEIPELGSRIRRWDPLARPCTSGRSRFGAYVAVTPRLPQSLWNIPARYLTLTAQRIAS